MNNIYCIFKNVNHFLKFGFVLREKHFVTNLGHFITMGLSFPLVSDILTAKRGDGNGLDCDLR